jgi:endoglucanase
MKQGFAVLLVSLLSAGYCFSQMPGDKIRLNQLGFYPNATKIAVVVDGESTDFNIRKAGSGKIVYSGTLGEPRKSDFSPRITRIADFSELKKKGSYIMEVPETGESFPFEIGASVLRDLSIGVIKGFYFQRMSTPLPGKYAGIWEREAGHPDTVVIIHPSAASPGRPEGSFISSPKGWYDAGDYNKYVVNSGITMGTMLSAWEDFSTYFAKLDLNIPESSNKVPDLLDEILWNLRWMLTMQDPADGGVYNKVTAASFEDMIMPSMAVKPRYVVQKGTGATLSFAAVMAQASRIMSQFSQALPGLADSCLTAAEYAWVWARNNPGLAYNQNAMNKIHKPEISTGGYGDNNFSDEFIWAAAELFITTGNDTYYSSVRMMPDTLMPLPSWGNVRLLGYYSLARFNTKLKGVAATDFNEIERRIIRSAEGLIKGTSEQPYNTVMGKSRRDFVWGSNSVAANQGILLIQAYKLSGDRKFLEHALANLDYLLGRNATGYSFVTGFGHKTPMFIHHRPSEADDIPEPVPGLLAGGPNPGRQDGCDYPSDIPDEAYSDSVCSYASNEIAINWNAPLVYLVAAVEALIR